MSDPLPLGEVVYEPYSPGKLGFIIGVQTKATGYGPEYVYTIRWKNGEETEYRTPPRPKRLLDLIEDHEKKLDGHRERLAEMYRLVTQWKYSLDKTPEAG